MTTVRRFEGGPLMRYYTDMLRRRIPNRQFLITAAAVVGIAAASAGCALSLRNPDIVDLKRHPAKYHDRTVSVSGVVTNSWGLPLVPFRLYKVDDGTGEVTVISSGARTPITGERVRVKGRVEDVAIFGGRPLGLHIREQDLYVTRR